MPEWARAMKAFKKIHFDNVHREVWVMSTYFHNVQMGQDFSCRQHIWTHPSIKNWKIHRPRGQESQHRYSCLGMHGENCKTADILPLPLAKLWYRRANLDSTRKEDLSNDRPAAHVHSKKKTFFIWFLSFSSKRKCVWNRELKKQQGVLASIL